MRRGVAGEMTIGVNRGGLRQGAIHTTHASTEAARRICPMTSLRVRQLLRPDPHFLLPSSRRRVTDYRRTMTVVAFSQIFDGGGRPSLASPSISAALRRITLVCSET